jgi:release factor glutamine methyltransferase
LTTQDHSKQWKLVELINWTADYLAQKGFNNSRLQAERLLAHVLKMARVGLYLNFDRPLNNDELAEFKSVLKRRLAHEPIQYIIGEIEFFSLAFKVAPGVLIPRPETEVLVEKAMELCQSKFSHLTKISILDVGTGSGCIAVSIAKNVSTASVVAVDISSSALQIAQENTVMHNVQDSIRFELLDALKPWPDTFHHFFDVVLCNPPYIKDDEFANLDAEIRLFEPEIALLGGQDGLDFYKKFAPHLTTLIKPGGRIFFEISPSLTTNIISIFHSAGLINPEIYQDLSHKERILSLELDENVIK